MKKKKIEQYWIMPVWGCVDPQPLIGPFKTFNGMCRRAKKVYTNQDEEDAIFFIRTGNGQPGAGAFMPEELL